MVEIMGQLPESVAGCFGNTLETAARQLLGSAAVEGYRSQRLSRGQVGEGLHLDETEPLVDSPQANDAFGVDGVTRAFGDYQLIQEIAHGGMGVV